MVVLKILIVDDQVDNNYVLRVLLEGHGYEVIEALNGTEALRLGRLHQPDLVISDLLMPIMDGFTLLRHWMQDAQLKQIPFLVYTATYREPEDEKLALSLGAKSYLLKPLDVDDFLKIVSDTLNVIDPTDSVSEPTNEAEESASNQSYSVYLVRRLEERAIELEQATQALKEEIQRLKDR